MIAILKPVWKFMPLFDILKYGLRMKQPKSWAWHIEAKYEAP